MLGNIIKYRNSGISHGGALATGIDPENVTQVQQRAKGIIRKSGQMPVKSSAQNVMNQAGSAQFLEDQADLIGEEVSHRSRQIRAAVKLYGTATKFAGERMRAEEAYQQIGQAHHKQVMGHRLKTGVIQSESEGTHNAYSHSVIDSM